MYQKSWWYDLQLYRYRVWQTKISIYGSFFTPLPPPSKNQKNQNFEKIKKIASDIIILCMCTKTHNHMRYASWDTEWDRHNFFVILQVFALLPPSQSGKSKFWKYEKSTWRCHQFTHMCQKSQSHDVCFLRYGVWQTQLFCQFRLFFALLPHCWPQKLKLGKMSCPLTLLTIRKSKSWKNEKIP